MKDLHAEPHPSRAIPMSLLASTAFPFYPSHRPKFPPLPLLFLHRRRLPLPLSLPHCRRRLTIPTAASASTHQQQAPEPQPWGAVSAVLFDMDGVLCNSEDVSRLAAVELFSELGASVAADDFIPFMGTGEANFLGGVARAKGVAGFDTEAAKKRFYEIYIDKYARPNSGIGFPGALELITECKRRGLKVAVASSADRIKVDANLAASGLPTSIFDAIVSADAFENLKPAPDIFLAASKSLNVSPNECIVIEDALAGVQAAKAAGMRCIAVTTTLSEEILKKANPEIVRMEIGNVSIQDILYNHNSDEKMENSQNISPLGNTSSAILTEKTSPEFVQDIEVGGPGWLQGSRRDVLRYGSLGIAISCFVFTINNLKAMQYASLKGILNLFSGVNPSVFGRNEGDSQASRVQQLKTYITDLEASGSASNVPEFPSKLDWLNTAPLQFQRDLRGRVVLLDFWTYCCINCIHVLPDLEFLEKKYSGRPFTVIGVHSAKFDNEKDLEAIRNAVLRYNITHPVVNDGDMYLWRELGVNSWPTFVVVGPNGKILAQVSGEGRRRDLDDLIDAALLFYEEKKLLESKPIPLSLEKDSDRRLLTSPLKFPGKLAVDLMNNRLFISDSNHNRIVVTDLNGSFIIQVGSSGEEGFNDGSFEDASFNHPQGLAYNPKKNILYVADTENHALREINFVNETVRTLAGNGTKGSDYKGGKLTSQVLNSPWDVCYEPKNEIVYIAMAGQHQLWEHNTLDGVTKAFSGDGFERNLNGLSSSSTSFAQPSGVSLSTDMQEVYVADSESSSIRAVDLKTGGSKLLAGGDPLFADNLFRFGDKDGIGTDALFQHPLGVLCSEDGQIYVADSYNHKIKKLDPVSRKVTTLAGTGSAGFKDGPALSAQLSEPSGITEAGNGKLLVADTNNSAIRYLDLNEKDIVLRTLELKGVQPPSSKPKSLKRLRRRLSADTQIVMINGGSSTEGYMYLRIYVPEGCHFSKEARSKFDVESDPPNGITIDPSNGMIDSDGFASLRFTRTSSSPAVGRINCKVYYCKEDEVCLYQSLAFDVSFQQTMPESNPAEISLSYTLKPKGLAGNSLLVNNR